VVAVVDEEEDVIEHIEVGEEIDEDTVVGGL